MLRLYHYPGNASLAPHLLLNEIGAPFELALVDRTRQAHKAPDYLKLNPLGRLPALVDGDLVLFEAAAICLHLCDRHPEAGLAPPLGSAARAQFYKWLIYLTNTLQAELMVYFYPERHTADEAAIPGVKAMAERRCSEMLNWIERELAGGGPWLLGDRLSAADFYLLMLGRWSRVQARPGRDRPALRALMERLLARPAVQRTFAAEGLTAPRI